MAKYRVGIKEVHVNYIEIETDETDKSKIKELAEEKVGDYMDDIYMEFSHAMSRTKWSVEKV